jgi:hypothetical protein
MDFKKITAALALVGTIATGIWTVESRYVIASDYQEEQTETKEQLYKRIHDAEGHSKLKIWELELKMVSWEIRELEITVDKLGESTPSSMLEQLDYLKRKRLHIEGQLGY